MSATPSLTRAEAQVLALAGLTQAVSLALSVARDGQAEPQATEASIGSVLALEADSAEASYGGLAGVRTGLRVLIGQLRGEQRDNELIRIAATIISLERKYQRNGDMQRQLRRRLEAISARTSPGAGLDGDTVGELAEAYLATISTLTPRVRIPGNPIILKDEANVRRIRAFLLAALRSAALWRQLGGAGWRLLLQRPRLIETAQRLLGRSLAAV